jgi:gliding motility-associated-like protein
MATPAATTVYRVQTTSAAGCVAEASVEVVVAAGPAAFSLPSGFSPNGDGLNDCFGVGAWGAVSRLQFRIYNRWGNLVFQTTDPAQCWDGTYKGQKLPGEVFIYQVSATTHCGPVTRKGTVLILR